ncbi:MAG: hypothetical protein ACO28M_03515 [Vulcanococcus sp.]
MTLPQELISAYWADAELAIDDTRRIQAVVHKISQMIRTWAPAKEQAKICHLAINEVADRLLREMEEENPY